MRSSALADLTLLSPIADTEFAPLGISTFWALKSRLSDNLNRVVGNLSPEDAPSSRLSDDHDKINDLFIKIQSFTESLNPLKSPSTTSAFSEHGSVRSLHNFADLFYEHSEALKPIESDLSTTPNPLLAAFILRKMDSELRKN
ncbi:hypothetical protein J6590_081309 [Homalodisca vitripennis]|nr:hypothetical protein J6590_081309 [Homalodisca vitripennis]